MTSFVSVSTSAARYQDLSLNPQKLAGQCAKLKCCLNYETDTYAEAQRDIPAKDIILETKDSSYYLFKSDVFKRTMMYSTSKDFLANAATISVERAKEIIALNRKGIRVDSLVEAVEKAPVKQEFGDILGQDALNRFDKSKKPNKNKNREHRGPRTEGQPGERIAGAGFKPERREGDRREGDRRNDRPKQERENQPRQGKEVSQRPNKNRDRRPNPSNGPRFEKPQKPGSSTPENNA